MAVHDFRRTQSDISPVQLKSINIVMNVLTKCILQFAFALFHIDFLLKYINSHQSIFGSPSPRSSTPVR